MFMSRASELLQESSSIHCQSLRARERREAVWGFGEAAEPGGVGADVGVGGGVKVSVTALFVAAEDDDGFVFGLGAGVDVVEEMLGAGEMVGASADVAAEHAGGPGFRSG